MVVAEVVLVAAPLRNMKIILLVPLLLAASASAHRILSQSGVHTKTHVSKTLVGISCAEQQPAEAEDWLTLDNVVAMFADVRTHFRESGEVDEGQVCRNMMVTRVDDFKVRVGCCSVAPSQLHGDGLFADRDVAEGELLTFFPGDALLFWADGDRENSDVMCFFGAHVPQSERDANEIVTDRVKSYELYVSGKISAIADPSRRSEPAYLGHFANDGSTCPSPEDVESYRRDSAAAANARVCLLENCHFALQASQPIKSGDEILLTYGEGYWLARGGHKGTGTDLVRVGSGPPEAAGGGNKPNQALGAALKASRKAKKQLGSKKPTKAGAKAKARKAASAPKAAAKGFGS